MPTQRSSLQGLTQQLALPGKIDKKFICQYIGDQLVGAVVSDGCSPLPLLWPRLQFLSRNTMG